MTGSGPCSFANPEEGIVAKQRHLISYILFAIALILVLAGVFTWANNGLMLLLFGVACALVGAIFYRRGK
jgi:hypothetical protein